MIKKIMCQSAFWLLISMPIMAAEQLIINSMHSDPTARSSFTAVVDKFKVANPSVKVTVNTVDHESYKLQIRTWLPNNPPDIATWFAGNRARYFVDRGLIEPIDDVWKDIAGDFSQASKQVVTFNNKKYLMPTTYYHWGFYYRKDIFAKAGVKEPPKTWEELLEVTKKVKAIKVNPITIGTKGAWPAAAWFDFISLRTNGYDFHMKLMEGKVKYTDPKVKLIMDKWAELVNLDAFPKTASAMTWQEASSLLWLGKSSMYLMGNFIATEIPAHVQGDIGFFPFPIIDPAVARTEVAPTDVYFIPAKAKNKATAKKFLAFLATPEIQGMLSKMSSQLPPNQKAVIDPNDSFLVAGMNLLNAASNVSQFYDRDADPEVAKVGMDGFVEFMSFPDRITKVLDTIEKSRNKVHKDVKM